MERRRWLIVAAVCVVSVRPLVAAGWQASGVTVLPTRDLRGYGPLSAEFTQYGDRGSRLRIRARQAGREALPQAKFVSDLHLLDGVRDEPLLTAGPKLTVSHLPGGGALTTWRLGPVTTILTVRDPADLPSLVADQPAESRTGAETSPTGRVPMYLDSWDKYGFRWYYYPWQTPNPDWGAPKQVEWRDYHVLGEFDFAKQVGDLGFVFWGKPEMTDLAEGLNDNLFWDWGAHAAALRGTPMVLNSSVETSPTWLLNRWRDDARTQAPDYLGGFYSPGDNWSSAKGNLSWSSGPSADEQYEVLQGMVREYAARPNTLEYLEPHGEMRHGEHDILTEYGPVADRNYREWLKSRYGGLPAVAARWDRPLKSWDEVRVPELAEFLGFDRTALDLAGRWRVNYDPSADAAYQPATDDSGWPELVMPGHDLALFTERKPAVFRRHVAMDAGWRAKAGRLWLYVLDLNRAGRESVLRAVLNGEKVGESQYDGPEHWAAFEVTKALRDGDNLLAMSLPRGFLGYRIYLSAHEPADYPYLGAGLNAQWADFTRWTASTRVEQLRRGFSALRQVDSDRSVIAMSPLAYESGIKQLCEQYGGHFHDTGSMSGWWAEPGPMLMRGADLPFSLEPGNHPHTVDEFKRFFGHWITEGNNAIHYFIHVGGVYWHEGIRAAFEEQLPLVKTVGKTHIPKAELAFLLTDDADNLTGFPWGGRRGDNLPGGYVPAQLNIALHPDFHSDAVTDLDFASGGAADGYRVVIDTNTSVMDPDRVEAIAGWVRRGGTFITFNQTGRHSSTQADAWPVSALTGYDVTKVDLSGRPWTFAPGQDVLSEAAWPENERRGSGLVLKPRDPGCREVIRWAGGGTALGWRSLGRGRVVQVGLTYDHNPQLWNALCDWAGLTRLSARVTGADARRVIATHLVSNNGLYDVWALWNTDAAAPVTVDLTFRTTPAPATALDRRTGRQVPLTGLAFGPGETRLLLLPRSAPERAPLDWLTLQRNWWRGTAAPVRTLPPYQPRFALDLTESWAARFLDDKDDADHTALAAPSQDDATWPRQRLSSWLVPDEQKTHRGLFRRSFTVPATWRGGSVELWMQPWVGDVVVGRLRVWLDGREIRGFDQGGRGLAGLDLSNRLTPGSRHLLAVEVASQGEVAGLYGHSWLYSRPAPAASDDLSGEWALSPDALLTTTKAARLPGEFDGLLARRTVRVDAAHAGQNVLFNLGTDPGSALIGVIVNGHYVARLHHDIGSRTLLNITPWIRFGADNEVIIKRREPGRTAVRSVQLDYYARGVYP